MWRGGCASCASEPSKPTHYLQDEDKAKKKLWEFAVAGKSLSEIDSALANIRRDDGAKARSMS